MSNTVNIDSVACMHGLLGLPAPDNPYISVSYGKEFPSELLFPEGRYHFEIYFICNAATVNAPFVYGRNIYSFHEGDLFFIAPRQMAYSDGIYVPFSQMKKGWVIMLHPDFIKGEPLANSLPAYPYFDYDVNEALYVSEGAQDILLDYINKM